MNALRLNDFESFEGSWGEKFLFLFGVFMLRGPRDIFPWWPTFRAHRHHPEALLHWIGGFSRPGADWFSAFITHFLLTAMQLAPGPHFDSHWLVILETKNGLEKIPDQSASTKWLWIAREAFMILRRGEKLRPLTAGYDWWLSDSQLLLCSGLEDFQDHPCSVSTGFIWGERVLCALKSLPHVTCLCWWHWNFPQIEQPHSSQLERWLQGFC